MENVLLHHGLEALPVRDDDALDPQPQEGPH
jgi:hypothetical protein